MDEVGFANWLRKNGDQDATVSTRLSNLRRLEAQYGDLQSRYEDDLFEGIFSELDYSKIDARNNEPNPSGLSISGDLYNSLASLRTHLRKYVAFLESGDEVSHLAKVEEAEEVRQAAFGLEKDLQAALRSSLEQLEQGVTIADGGVEKKVDSGFIDIFATDANGAPVVIELKAVKAPLKAISQIMSYLGDIAEETGQLPRGILIAPDFDPKLVAAARIAPSIKLVNYGFSFHFSEVASGPVAE